jgi:hypothetical protein
MIAFDLTPETRARLLAALPPDWQVGSLLSGSAPVDDPQYVAHRARDILRYLQACRRDALVAGPGSEAWDRWQREAVRLLPQVMTLLAEACGIDLPR